MKASNVVSLNVSKAPAYMDWSQAISGVILSLFMLCHTLFIFSVVFGAKVFNKVALFFEDTGLAQTGGVILALIFLVHFILAARKIPFSFKEQQTVWKHAKMLKHQDTWLWLVQVFTGMSILLLGSIHLWVILNDLPITALKSKLLIQSGLWLYFNILFLLCIALHLGIGLYRVGAKWGFVTRANRSKIKKIVFGLIGALIVLDVISLIRFYFV
ncbi:succinate dehydrogenase subunit C [Desulfonauticus submarinus]|uniref:Succinate dehydrogenase subunit C n=1 Tax=Desulfonauticus submarinus TaxID=206665 RepID=A0A1H0AEY3_9BACT|nr:succinate dehydrogenase/fumarate reductase cytochrome b subunit [Desulfonauticus submarinus]SDN31995.1 succinate dehydrogenase subunit C [Desulfonauticus submarinus]